MRNVLIVVDVQNDFVDLALGTKEAVGIIPAVLREIADPKYDTVIATMDTHTENYLNTFEGKHLPVKHCVKDTEGWQIFPAVRKALDERDNVIIVEKPTFGSIDLTDMMIAEAPESITLIGLCTDICVISNALLIRAGLPDTEICVVADACAATTPAKHLEALSVMASCQIEIQEK